MYFQELKTALCQKHSSVTSSMIIEIYLNNEINFYENIQRAITLCVLLLALFKRQSCFIFIAITKQEEIYCFCNLKNPS